MILTVILMSFPVASDQTADLGLLAHDMACPPPQPPRTCCSASGFGGLGGPIVQRVSCMAPWPWPPPTTWHMQRFWGFGGAHRAACIVHGAMAMAPTYHMAHAEVWGVWGGPAPAPACMAPWPWPMGPAWPIGGHSVDSGTRLNKRQPASGNNEIKVYACQPPCLGR